MSWEDLDILKTAEDAPGIPNRLLIPDPPTVTKPVQWDFSIQRHKARRAGVHDDLRIISPDGAAHSWAVRHWPKPGQSIVAPQQPVHSREYALSFGAKKPENIPEGYGAGTVRIRDTGKTTILESGPDKVTFNIQRGRKVEEYSLIHQDGVRWRLVNHTTTAKKYDVPAVKPKFTSVDINTLAEEMPEGTLQPKVDGAHALFHLVAGKRPRLFSPRRREGSGDVIEYSHKLPGLFSKRVPKGLGETLLRVEVFARDSSGVAVPPERVSGMLNAGVARSVEKQKEEGTLRVMPFDVARHRGRDVQDLPYSERLKLLKRTVTALHSSLVEKPRTAVTPKEKASLLKEILSGKAKETREGVVIWPEQGRPMKAKIAPDHDVYIREPFQTAESKVHDWAGGFKYSLTPRGPVVGQVGGGLSHSLREDLLKHFDKYRGRAAKIRATGQFPSGALKQPTFVGFHVEKGRQP